MKRAACLLLMPAVLLTQWGGLGHCHGGNTPAGHGLRPHVHTGLPSHAHGHGHRHGHHGYHHHGPGGHHHHHGDDEADGSHAPPAFPHPSPSDHDSDAIHLAAVDAVSRAQHGDELAPTASVTLGVEVTAGGWDDLAGRAAFRSGPPPVSAGPTRPLYVRHLALLL